MRGPAAAMTLALHLSGAPSDALIVTEIVDQTGDGEGNGLDQPWDIALDSAGNGFVSSVTGPTSSVFRIGPGGTVTEYEDLFADFGVRNPSGLATDVWPWAPTARPWCSR
jgi:hypothetical protein